VVDVNEAPSIGYMTEERIQMRDMARDFVRKELLPLANRLDPVRGDMPRELIEKMGDLGFFGILIPEELGGLGLGAFEFCLVAEELARGWMSASSIIARGNAGYLTVPGSGEERKEKIRLMARGRYLGASALSEPGTGSDLSGISCRARKDGDHWVISGNKYWCTFADGANFIRVLCRVEGEEAQPGRAGTAIIPVEKPAGQLPEGVTGNPIPKI
jgi:alkylation response protein AidB-like acyl-CoA dehydrogenase